MLNQKFQQIYLLTEFNQRSRSIKTQTEAFFCVFEFPSFLFRLLKFCKHNFIKPFRDIEMNFVASVTIQIFVLIVTIISCSC